MSSQQYNWLDAWYFSGVPSRQVLTPVSAPSLVFSVSSIAYFIFRRFASFFGLLFWPDLRYVLEVWDNFLRYMVWGIYSIAVLHPCSSKHS